MWAETIRESLHLGGDEMIMAASPWAMLIVIAADNAMFGLPEPKKTLAKRVFRYSCPPSLWYLAGSCV
jgi:hypothetical protein